ncbi:protein phosphatase 2C domain-containing protein [Streptomyces sp. CG1]|uniref:protein phosphatase 2C domain-containing protein n=1 Tax=Streptomyces sp. CG1 TaxID=1287523 RepID=UPI0034E2C903
MSQQGGRPARPEDDWWGQLYDDSTEDTGPGAAPDTLDDRFASAKHTVTGRQTPAARDDAGPGDGDRGSGADVGGDVGTVGHGDGDPPTALSSRPALPSQRAPEPPPLPPFPAPTTPVDAPPLRHTPWDRPPAPPEPPRPPEQQPPAPPAERPVYKPPTPTAPADRSVPEPPAPPAERPVYKPPTPTAPADRSVPEPPAPPAERPVYKPPTPTAPADRSAPEPLAPPGERPVYRPPMPTAPADRSAPEPLAPPAERPVYRPPMPPAPVDRSVPEPPAPPADRSTPEPPAPPAAPAVPPEPQAPPAPAVPPQTPPAITSPRPPEAAADDPAPPSALVPPPPPPSAIDYVGSGPPTYDPEPTALPGADPDGLGELVADTVLDGARYGACTLRAVSLRGDSARYRGEPRRDSLLTARFGVGEQALVLVAMATGVRGMPDAHLAAAEACRWIGQAVGRSHQRLVEDIRAARRGELKSGLQRLTDRSLGRLRASAAEQGADPEAYTASLRCLLLPADPDCRTRVFFGVGDGGLFRLRDGAWQDIEPQVAPDDSGGAPAVGFGSPTGKPGKSGAAFAETPEGDRFTMDLGIPTPPSPYEPAPEPPREPFRFRASPARTGDALVMCSAGLAEPLRGEAALCAYLARRWSGRTPPGLAAFLADAQVRVKGYADDRTAAAVWEA